MVPRITLQRVLIAGLLAALILAAVRFFAVQGWVRPIRIVSGSMVDRLWGEHFVVTCAECEFVFRYGVESPPRRDRAVCPNCGFGGNIARKEWRRRGDRVWIDRGAYWFDPPRRYDLVAFRDPRQPYRKVVKRVLGLPGEEIGIRHGDVYVDGSLLRKSIHQFDRVSILVHDNARSPKPEKLLPARWRSDSSESGWQARGAGFVFQPKASQANAVREADTSHEEDWLNYHHWRCYANSFPRSAEAPVSDNYGYNQGESRELREVSDLIIWLKVGTPVAARLQLRVHDGRDWCEAVLDFVGKQVSFTRAGQELGGAPLTVESEPAIEIQFGTIDRQMVLAIDGEEMLRIPYDPGTAPRSHLSTPLGIRVLDGELNVERLRVYRDVYYLDPWLAGQPWEMSEPLSPSGYFVLGDNPPLSDDSRRWKKPFLARSAILGRVIPYPK